MKSLIIFFTLTLGSGALADPVEQVRCREVAFSVSVETQDVALFASFIDADARFVGNSVLHGPDAIAEAWGDEEGVETERWGTFNSVWRLHKDGEWRVVFDAGSDPVETPTDEVKALLDQEYDCDNETDRN